MYEIAEFLLPTDLETFVKLFWKSSSFYHDFLAEKLNDKHVVVGEWRNTSSSSSSSSSLSSSDNKEHTQRSRDISSHHPSKISFPGLPAYAESYKTQM